MVKLIVPLSTSTTSDVTREVLCMPLDPNKFTRKTQEAIGAAQALGA